MRGQGERGGEGRRGRRESVGWGGVYDVPLTHSRSRCFRLCWSRRSESGARSVSSSATGQRCVHQLPRWLWPNSDHCKKQTETTPLVSQLTPKIDFKIPMQCVSLLLNTLYNVLCATEFHYPAPTEAGTTTSVMFDMFVVSYTNSFTTGLGVPG